MGGRGSASASSKASVMSEQEYLSRKGVGSPISDYTLDTTRLPHGETLRQRDKRIKEGSRVAAEHQRKRDAARAEYRQLVDAGKMRAPTSVETALRIAQGHSDNAATQAARRSLKKRGIDWKTGKAL